MHGINGMDWGMGWWWIIAIVFVTLIVWVVVKAKNSNRSDATASGKSALDILKERYAKGEISKEEFEERRKELK